MFVVSNVLYPAVHKLGTLSKLLIFDTARLETLKLQHMREIEYAKKTFFFYRFSIMTAIQTNVCSSCASQFQIQSENYIINKQTSLCNVTSQITDRKVEKNVLRCYNLILQML